MDNILIGALAVFGTPHLVLVAVPLTETIRSRISPPSKLVWALFLLLLPVAGVAFTGSTETVVAPATIVGA